MAKPEDTLTLETTKGKVVIEMRPDLAPGHVARIKELVKDGFYDGIVFHRVIDGFMAQTGCPHGTGTGGSGKKLKAEFNAEPHVRGTVSMARASNPDSGDSQFFICFRRRALSRQAIHCLGQGDRRHGQRRQDQARRTGQRSGQDC
jgi:peptidylprolyl isomerase